MEPPRSKWTIHPLGVKLGLLYALVPLGIAVGEWARGGDPSAGHWLAVAAGVVMGSVTLATSQGYDAGFAAGKRAADEAGAKP